MMDYLGRNVPDLWGVDGPSCPDGCSPVDISIPFGHGPGPCDICPHVRCAICGAWAESESPAGLVAAWFGVAEGQTSWI